MTRLAQMSMNAVLPMLNGMTGVLTKVPPFRESKLGHGATKYETAGHL